jgi:hypothetical protein
MTTDRQAKRISSVNVAELKSEPKKVTQLASRPGGVRVVDDDGNERFRLSIPATRID